MGFRHLIVMLVAAVAMTSASCDVNQLCADNGAGMIGEYFTGHCDCNRYIKCSPFGIVASVCPPGELYNDKIKACSSLCDFDCKGAKPAACPTSPPPGKTCTTTKRCLKRKGSCIPKTEACAAGGKVIRGGCKGRSCKCCATKAVGHNRCHTGRRCGSSGGTCQNKNQKCDGKLVMRLCPKGGCGCCIPEA